MIQEVWPIGYLTCPHYQFYCNGLLKSPEQQPQLHLDEDFRARGFFMPIKLQTLDFLILALTQWMELLGCTKLKQDIQLCYSNSSLWT
jgi:hypothetical protein